MKIPHLLSAIAFGAALLLQANVQQASALSTVPPPRLLRSPEQAAVYYSLEDGRRYAFPNQNIYRSWYSSFDAVQTVSASELAQFRLAGSVLYRPGALIKITTDPKVYLVTANGELRWVQTEAIAQSLFGGTWASQVEDVSDAFFFAYRIGAPILAGDTLTLAAVRAEAHAQSILANQELLLAPPSSTTTIPLPNAPTSTATTTVATGFLLNTSRNAGVRGNESTNIDVYTQGAVPEAIYIRINGALAQNCRQQTRCSQTFTHTFQSTATSYVIEAETTYADGTRQLQTKTLPVLDLQAGALALITTNLEIRTPTNIDLKAQWFDLSSRPSRVAVYVNDQEQKSCFDAFECTLSYAVNEPLGTTLSTYAIAESTSGQQWRTPTSSIAIVSNPKPVIAINNPTTLIFGNQQVSLNVQANDEDGIAFIEIYENGMLLQRCDRPTCSYTSAPITEGRTLMYQVVAQDLRGARQEMELVPMLVVSGY